MSLASTNTPRVALDLHKIIIHNKIIDIQLELERDNASTN
jgi:hypothetical protein